jgi:hypothetical protein
MLFSLGKKTICTSHVTLVSYQNFTRYQARLGNAGKPSSAWQGTLTIDERGSRKV